MAVTLADFGSYRVGGRLHRVSGEPVREIAVTPTTRFTHDPNGTFPVESAYVQYFVPAHRRDLPPLVLVHGGGMTGAMWERTPDGRPGWLQAFLASGREVHVVDNVERGRAGWVPGLWPGEPVLRSMEEAWALFRFGRAADFAARRAFPGCRFPVAHLEAFAASFVPRWTSTTQAQAGALAALLDRLGRADIVCHSQGAEVAFRAAVARPGTVASIVAVEPSGLPEPDALPGVPVTILAGDFLDASELWAGLSARWAAFARARSEAGERGAVVSLARGFRGATHFPMLDAGCEDVVASLAGVAW